MGRDRKLASWRRILVLVALAVSSLVVCGLSLSSSGCAPLARQQAAAGLGLASLAPDVCLLAPSTSATVCGAVAGDVSAAAALVATILSSWPKVLSAKLEEPLVVLLYDGCRVILPQSQALYVQQQLQVRADAKALEARR